MSKRKRNIAYIKPEEPPFLRRLKAQAGILEEAAIDTERDKRPYSEDEDEDEDEDEAGNDRSEKEQEPVVVVLRAGDLTAEEAEAIKKQKEDDKANAKADLTKRVIFKRNKTSLVESSGANNDARTKGSKKAKKPNKVPLSFDQEDDE